MVELSSLVSLTEKLDTTFAKDIVSHTDSALIRMSQFQKVIDNIDSYVAVVSLDLKMIMTNKKMATMLNERLGVCPKAGDPVYKTLYNLDEIPSWDPFIPAIKRRRVTMREFISPTTKRKYGLIAIPLIYNGVSGVIAIATDEDEI